MSVAQLFTHINSIRLAFVLEDVSEFTVPVPEEEWPDERDRGHIEEMPTESAWVARERLPG